MCVCMYTPNKMIEITKNNRTNKAKQDQLPSPSIFPNIHTIIKISDKN